MNIDYIAGFLTGGGIILILSSLLIMYNDLAFKRIKQSVDIENEILRKTLYFYAEKSNYNYYTNETWDTTQIELDEGENARQALVKALGIK